MIRVAVLTISDSVVAGTREDRSGAMLRDRAQALGWTAQASEVVPDDAYQIAAVLRRWADSGQVSVILTTGGTGVAARDVTPEATTGVLERTLRDGRTDAFRRIEINAVCRIIARFGRSPWTLPDCQPSRLAQGSRRVLGRHCETGPACRRSTRRENQP